MENPKQDSNEVKGKLEDLLSWSNELPEQLIVNGEEEYKRHKFRTIWFKDMASLVSSADQGLAERANKLRDQVLKMREESQLINSSHIDQGDQLIKQALEKL
jgi:hypothetical protein